MAYNSLPYQTYHIEERSYLSKYSFLLLEDLPRLDIHNKNPLPRRKKES